MAKRIVDEEMRFTLIVNGNAAQKELYDLEKSNRTLLDSNKALRQEKARLLSQGKKNTAEYKILNNQLKENNNKIKLNKDRMQVLQKQIGITSLTLGQLRKEASRLRLALNNMVPGSAKYIKYQKELQNVNTQLAKLRVGAKNTKSSILNFTNSSLTKFSGLLGGLFAVRRAFNFIEESKQFAQDAKGIEFAFQKIEERTKDAEAALLRAKESTRGLLSDLDIKKAIVELDNFNISTEQTDTLLEFLAVRATQTGESIDSLRTSLVEGLSKESKLRIDNLGISMKELNQELEKAPDFVTAVANIAKKEIGEAGNILDEAANSQSKWNAALKNFKLFVGTGFIAKITDKMYDFGSNILRAITPTKELTNATKQEKFALNQLVSEIMVTNDNQDKRNQLINQLSEEYPFFLQYIKDEETNNKNLKTALAEVNSMYIKRLALERVIDKVQLSKKQGDLADRTAKLAEVENDYQTVLDKVNSDINRGNIDTDLKSKSLQQQNKILRETINTELERLNILKANNVATPAQIRNINRYNKRLQVLTDATRVFTSASTKFGFAETAVEDANAEIKKIEEQLGLTKEEIEQNFQNDPVVITTSLGEIQARRKKQGSKNNQAKNEADELLQLQRETEDKRLAIIQDAFLREMALNDESQRRKIADLSDKAAELDIAYSKAILSGNTDLASKLQDQYNEVLDQMELEEQLHIQKRTDILESGIATHIDKLKERYQKEESQRLTAHNNELAALGDNEDAKKALQDKFNKEKLEREKANLIALQTEINNIISTQTFEGFDLDILTDEQLQKIKDNLQSLGLSLSEINVLLAKMRGDSVENELSLLGVGGDVDLLGMSGEQWEKMFQRTETWQAGLAKAAMFAQAATEAYSMYHKFASAAEDRKLQKMQQSYDKEVAKQKRLLDNKLISEKQYNDAVEAEEKKLRKKQAEIEYKRAKREKAMNIASIITSTALAVVKALPNIPLSVAVGAIGAANLALALAQPLPAKGYEKGFYDNTVAVRRQQDGKVFNAAYGGESRSGVVDKPTMFLAGEGGKNFPELIISGPDLKQFDPNLKQSLYREIGRVKGYEEGYYKNVEGAPGNDDDQKLKMMMMQVLQENVEILKQIKEEGIEAYVTRNFTNAKRLRDDINRLEKIESKSKINT